MRGPAPILMLAALAGCGEGDANSRMATPEPRQEAAREAALAALRHRLRPQGAIEQRGVQVFAQALPDMVAVCGRARLPGSVQAPYLPYVAVVEFSGQATAVVRFHLGASGAEASRVFLDMVDRCFDGGGPPSARPMARNLPPLPELAGIAPAEPQAASATSTAAPGASAAQPGLQVAASGSVTTSSRMGANIRSSTRGGEVVRTVPPGTSLQVFAEAPGGWFQVGEAGVALGWIHASVLEGR